MSKKINLSPTQLGLLMIGFLFGDFEIMNPSRSAYQDAWISLIIGWAIGILLMAMYITISKLNPQKTLIEIILSVFGKYLGTIVSLLYIWYFIHLSSLIFRAFMEYMITVNYPEMSILIPFISSMIVVMYIIRSGFEVTARLLSFVITFLLIFTVIVQLLLIKEMDFKNLLPVLNFGWKPVLKTGYGIATFPFGELIVFLMIFPLLNNKKKLVKTTSLAVGLGGLFLLSIVLRDLVVLGPDLSSRTVFPSHIVGSLVPTIVLEPIISTNLLIAGGAMVIPTMYAGLKGIEQVFNVEDYRPFILGIGALVVSISMWLYDNITEMFEVSKRIYPYYSTLFQIVFPLIILLISVIRYKKYNKKVLSK